MGDADGVAFGQSGHDLTKNTKKIPTHMERETGKYDATALRCAARGQRVATLGRDGIGHMASP